MIPYLVAHSTVFLALITVALASLMNRLPADKVPTWLHVVVDVLAVVPRPGNVGVFGPVNVPGLPSKLPGGAVPPAALALFLLPLLALQGCAACKLPANAALPKCVLQAHLISCGEQDAFALIPVVVGLVGGLIAGQPFDPAALVQQLELQGVKDVPCVIAAIEAYLMAPSPVASARVHEALKLALSARGLHGEVDVKLSHGRVIKAVLP